MQGTRRGLERFGGPVKTGRAGSLGGGACGPGGLPPPALSTPSGGISGRRGQGKVSCQAAPAPRCPVHYQGQPRLSRCRARRLQPAEEPSQSQRSRLRARPPPSARGPRSQRWDRWNRAAPGGEGSGRASTGRAWRRGVAPPQRPSRSQGTPATCQCAPIVRREARGGGSGDSATPTLQAPAGAPAPAPAGRGPLPTLPLPLLAERAAEGPGAESCPPPTPLPPGARVPPPGHSPPQLSVLCSPAGNDLRKRLGQGLRQAARARR